MAPALPEIQREFGASPTATGWLVTGYLLSASVLTPILARVGDMFGKDRVLVAALGVLALGLALAALADSIGLLILGRVVQGAGGAIFPLAFGIIRDVCPPDRAVHAIATISGLLGVGGGLGIVVAGPVVETLGIAWLFWLPCGIVVLTAAAALAFVPPSPVRAPGRIDWAGALLLSAWLVALLLGIDQAAAHGVADARVLVLAAVALAGLIVWMRQAARTREPLVDLRTMRLRGVWTLNVAGFLLGGAVYVAYVLVPQLTTTPPDAGFGFGATVTEAGLFLLPTSAFLLIASQPAGLLASRLGARVTLIVGSSAMALAFVLLALAHDRPAEVYVGTALLGAALAFAFGSLATLMIQAVPPDQTAVATGVNTVMRTLGGALGAQVGVGVVAGVAAAKGAPAEHGFVLAFLLAAAMCVLAVVASVAVPARGRG